MNVLSLFDGMSCGRIALERAGINVANYFASEIDKYAIKVSKANWTDVTQIGNVTDISYEDGMLITSSGNYKVNIDLIIGGSPCQSFSTLGNGSGFDGKSGLFYEYLRLLREVKPKNFLLENVRMKKEWKDLISKELGVEPIEINSNLVSAQNRARLYWTNITGVIQPENKCVLVNDVIGDYSKHYNVATQIKLNGKRVYKLLKEKTGCITSRYSSGANGLGRTFLVKKDAQDYQEFCKNDVLALTPEILEKLQTVPVGYTSTVSNTQRCKMLGNGWTVDVIAHILKGLKE